MPPAGERRLHVDTPSLVKLVGTHPLIVHPILPLSPHHAFRSKAPLKALINAPINAPINTAVTAAVTAPACGPRSGA
jgi:hypothetical protein